MPVSTALVSIGVSACGAYIIILMLQFKGIPTISDIATGLRGAKVFTVLDVRSSFLVCTAE